MSNKNDKNVDLNSQEELNDVEIENEAVDTNKLIKEINVLKKTLDEKNEIINNLNKKIEEYNANYLNEINKKSNEAQEILKNKINEYQTKFDKELANIKKYALKDKITDLIDIINNFEVAVNAPVKDPVVNNYVQGFKMFSNMFSNYLLSNNITSIEPKIGDEYDSKIMEAFEVVSNPELKPNCVSKVIKKGYKLHDIVIIPATVVVSK